jgi:hypothetical protein
VSIQNILRAHVYMVQWGMMFGEVVGAVVLTFVPVDAELFVRDLVT